MNRHFTEEDTHTINKHVKRCLILLVIKAMQMKITRYWYTSNRMLKQEAVTTSNAGKDAEKLDPSQLLVGIQNGTATDKQFGIFLKIKKLNMQPPQDPAIALLVI